MKKALLIALLAILACNTKAEIEPTAQFYGNMLFISNLHVKQPIPYSVNINNKDMEFTLYGDDLTSSRTVKLKNAIAVETWKPSDGEELEMRTSRIIPISDDRDYAVIYEEDIPFTQTFFNDDEKLEFIRAKVKLKSNDYEASFYMDGIEVVSEDGTVLAEIESPYGQLHVSNGQDLVKYGMLYTLVLGDNRYLIWMHEPTYDQRVLTFYRISTNSNKLVLEKTTQSVVYPNPVKQSQPLTISIDENSNASHVIISDISGREVSRQPLERGNSEISVSTNRLSQGQYIYTIVSDDKPLDSGKIIIK